ncbi:aquaporin-7 isoform X2 [Choloepus didactylus]|uniref:aquaporin-7 isoform X2 n=1 Tax=Choloepus didactylus TaxID=27675 RepID=UPI00189E7721|nr:aquaporin-7 isoform X2 [Choloepus didactylus]XP_037653458.1 aquaporin-7 isoform X2 [Choloepus didactylus]
MANLQRPRRSTTLWSNTIARIHAVLMRELVRVFLAEFVSTFVMMVFGLGSVAHMVLGGNKFGSYLGVNLGFGFGVTMGVHVAGGVSGAHMNAAVTFTNCVLGRMSWRKFPVYVLGQFLGSFLAAATTYCMFYESLMHFSGGELTVTGPTATAGIFATYLPKHLSLWQGFFDEAVLTGLLQMCLFAITDKQNNPPPEGAQALVIGVLVTVIGVSLGMNTGYAINPSRDLPPRFFTFLAGWGQQVFSAGDSWWWVPVVAPFLGAFFGGALYLLLIGFNIPRELDSLEGSLIFEEQRTSALPKSSPDLPVASPLSPVSSAERAPALSAPPLNDPALPLEHL